MADKQVNIKVATDVDDSRVDALEKKVAQLRREKLQWEIDVATQKLDETKAKIESLKQEKATLEVGVDDSRIDEINAEIAQLEGNSIDLQLSVDTSKLRAAEAEVEELDGKSINVDMNTGMQNVSQGLSLAKQGAADLAASINDVQQAGLQSEQNLAFLANNLPNGMADATKEMEKISDIVARMPGDDNTMRSVLTTAQALGNNLSTSEMEDATKTMADYMQGSATMGKQAIESQQDIMKYLLDGNTAELERGSIVSSQVDKLKEATTFQERQKAMQEVLNQLGYGGIASLDTTLNKQAEWEGMLYNSDVALSSMWLNAEKGAMDYIIQLNEATHGLAGMAIVGGQMVAGPLVDIMSGIGQIGMGLKTLKDGADFTGLTDKLKGVKNSLSNVKTSILETASNIKGSLVSALRNAGNAASGLATKLKAGLVSALTSLKKVMVETVIPTLKNLAIGLLDAGRKALLAGANAVKSAALWAIERGVKVVSTGVTYALAAAQAILNAVMSMNPIMLVVIALAALVAALVWAYQNVDWFRAMVDNAWASLVQIGQAVYTYIQPAIQWLGDLFNQFTSQLGLNTNDWLQALLGFILFLPTLPLQVGIALINTIANLLGFQGNFVQTMATTALTAVTNFITFISQLPGRTWVFLSNLISRVQSFRSTVISAFMSAASSAVSNFAGQISSLPGKLQAELQNMLSIVGEWAATLPQKFWDAGVNAVRNFLNALDMHSPGIMQRSMVWEVSEMARRVPLEGKNLVSNIGELGSDIVDNFQPELGIAWDDTMNADISNGVNGSVGGQVNNFYFSDIVVDNDDRMEKIYDYITHRLHWDNKTAGRTI